MRWGFSAEQIYWQFEFTVIFQYVSQKIVNTKKKAEQQKNEMHEYRTENHKKKNNMPPSLDMRSDICILLHFWAVGNVRQRIAFSLVFLLGNLPLLILDDCETPISDSVHWFVQWQAYIYFFKQLYLMFPTSLHTHQDEKRLFGANRFHFDKSETDWMINNAERNIRKPHR